VPRVIASPMVVLGRLLLLGLIELFMNISAVAVLRLGATSLGDDTIPDVGETTVVPHSRTELSMSERVLKTLGNASTDHQIEKRLEQFESENVQLLRAKSTRMQGWRVPLHGAKQALQQKTHLEDDHRIKIGASATKLRLRDKTSYELKRHASRRYQEADKGSTLVFGGIGRELNSKDPRKIESKLTEKGLEDAKLKQIVRALASRLITYRSRTSFHAVKVLEGQLKNERERNMLLWKENLKLQRANLALQAKSAEKIASIASRTNAMEDKKTQLVTNERILTAEVRDLEKNVTELRNGLAIVARQRAALQHTLRSYAPLRKELSAQATEKTDLEGMINNLQKRLTEARVSVLFNGPIKAERKAEEDANTVEVVWAEEQNLRKENLEGEEKYKEEADLVARLKKELRRVTTQGGGQRERSKVRLLLRAERRLAEVNRGLQMQIITLENRLKKYQHSWSVGNTQV